MEPKHFPAKENLSRGNQASLHTKHFRSRQGFPWVSVFPVLSLLYNLQYFQGHFKKHHVRSRKLETTVLLVEELLIQFK